MQEVGSYHYRPHHTTSAYRQSDHFAAFSCFELWWNRPTIPLFRYLFPDHVNKVIFIWCLSLGGQMSWCWSWTLMSWSRHCLLLLGSMVSCSIFDHACTLTFWPRTLTTVTSSSLSQDALLRKVWWKCISAYHRKQHYRWTMYAWTHGRHANMSPAMPNGKGLGGGVIIHQNGSIISYQHNEKMR